jgi:hypothetical protein
VGQGRRAGYVPSVTEWDYESLVETAQTDERVVGLVLTGSRGRGPFARPDSDWDVRLVVLDDALAEAELLFGSPRGAAVEVGVYSLTGFASAGEIGAPDEWDRYSYAYAEVVIDKLGGRIGELVAAKGALPADAAREIAARMLDTYINSYYRSAQNLGSGLTIEAHLDAAGSRFRRSSPPSLRCASAYVPSTSSCGSIWSSIRLATLSGLPRRFSHASSGSPARAISGSSSASSGMRSG